MTTIPPAKKETRARLTSSDVIVGGGVAALIASLYLSEPVTIITKPAKKNPIANRILVSGNGRCNFFNSMLLNTSYKGTFLEPYEEIVHDDIDYAREILDFLRENGIAWFIDDGLYYPFFNRAKDFYEPLMERFNQTGHNVIYGEVISIDRKNHIITYQEDEDTVKTVSYDRVMLSTGGISYDRGSLREPLIYSLGLPYTPFSPSLCPVKVKERIPSFAVGQRLRGKISLKCGKEYIYSEQGEVLFKKDGLSGIAVFNITHYINQYLRTNPEAKLTVEVDFGSHDSSFIGTSAYVPDYVREIKKYSLRSSFNTLLFTFVAFYPFKDSQVSSGGIKLDILNSRDLSVVNDPAFFVAGECIDASLPCGGFNIATAMIEGLKIAMSWEDEE